MPLRLVLGLLKGLVLGGLVGYGLAVVGMATPIGWIAYPAAAFVGMIIAAVAGKPIWAKDARIEVGMKALAAAIFAPGLLWLARSFLTLELPFDARLLPGVSATSATIGMFSLTSLALVAAVLGGFFEADNQPAASDESPPKTTSRPDKKRIDASAPPTVAEGDEEEAEAPKRRRA